jgi:trehalose 6-phosphate synthase
VGHGNGDADRDTVDEYDRIMVPPDDPSYTLRRVWLTNEEEEGYYLGFANGALWPLCHIAYTRPVFDRSQWETYVEVNRRFAAAVAQEAPRRSLVFVQDYHFALLPKYLRELRDDLAIGQFWHIPWPNPDVFSICPWKEEILEGLLSNDLLGFHIQHDCNNFLATVAQEVEARIDRENFSITRKGNQTKVLPFPISVDYPALEKQALGNEHQKEVRSWQEKLNLGNEAISVGVDRMDYTKGLLERIDAIDRFLTQHPKWKGNFVHIQVAVPSRSPVPAYQRLDRELNAKADACNQKHSGSIRLVQEHVSQAGVQALYQLANVCQVSSLHDGMNLVAKEFVATRTDEQGVLILSPFTGASRELTDAILVNPYAIDDLVDALPLALEMSKKEQKRRMRKMRQTVREHDIHYWARKILSEIGRAAR